MMDLIVLEYALRALIVLHLTNSAFLVTQNAKYVKIVLYFVLLVRVDINY